MSDVVSVFNFSGIYDEESFYREDKGSSFSLIDCRGISGTNCMCDDMAIEEIREKMTFHFCSHVDEVLKLALLEKAS